VGRAAWPGVADFPHDAERARPEGTPISRSRGSRPDLRPREAASAVPTPPKSQDERDRAPGPGRPKASSGPARTATRVPPVQELEPVRTSRKCAGIRDRRGCCASPAAGEAAVETAERRVPVPGAPAWRSYGTKRYRRNRSSPARRTASSFDQRPWLSPKLVPSTRPRRCAYASRPMTCGASVRNNSSIKRARSSSPKRCGPPSQSASRAPVLPDEFEDGPGRDPIAGADRLHLHVRRQRPRVEPLRSRTGGATITGTSRAERPGCVGSRLPLAVTTMVVG